MCLTIQVWFTTWWRPATRVVSGSILGILILRAKPFLLAQKGGVHRRGDRKQYLLYQQLEQLSVKWYPGNSVPCAPAVIVCKNGGKTKSILKSFPKHSLENVKLISHPLQTGGISDKQQHLPVPEPRSKVFSGTWNGEEVVFMANNLMQLYILDYKFVIISESWVNVPHIKPNSPVSELFFCI